MRLTLDVPDEYAEAVRQFLDARGYNDAPDQVRRVLRYTITHHLVLWWRTRRAWEFRRTNPDGTLGAPLPALVPPSGSAQRHETVIPVTAYGAANHPREAEAGDGAGGGG